MWMEMRQRGTAPNRKQHFGEAEKKQNVEEGIYSAEYTGVAVNESYYFK
jgi:hypothetical protein